MKNSRLSQLCHLALVFTMLSCGGTNFTGNNKGEDKKDPPPTDQPKNDDAIKTDEVIHNADSSITESFVADASKNPITKIDIIFAMDTSGSMDTEKSFLAKNMQSFVSKFTAEKRIDPQFFMIGKGFQFPTITGANFSVVDIEVDSWNSLGVLREFFEKPALSKIKLRTDAVKEIVVVTDDNADSEIPEGILDQIKIPIPGLPFPLPTGPTSKLIPPIEANTFLEYLRTNKAKTGSPVRVNGFVGLDNSAENDWCKIVNTGSEYLSFGQTEFKGVYYDLCTPDWNQLLSQLATSIIKQSVKSEFVIKNKVDIEKLDAVKVAVNGKELVRGKEWDFNKDKNSIYFLSGFAPNAGDKISVTFFEKE